ncbi:hypothetical protein BN77_1403 [Rhizobium mesoamericanum STM3625]|uniref:Transposase IS116/IS110/IS902 C-terminal domain-containing protein n=1 Tax=Rhizobium mesoamericanum STM3625 TaxID=1211777 RepID=K0PSD7_9HYPH|nr:hypothetical protein BN77_1403 [Rhizobium mesoamericanum STM3625]
MAPAAEPLASPTWIDRDLEALLERHPDGALIRSLPGMGAVRWAELIANIGTIERFHSADARHPPIRKIQELAPRIWRR